MIGSDPHLGTGTVFDTLGFTTDATLPVLPPKDAEKGMGLKLHVFTRRGKDLSIAAQAVHAVTAWEQEAPATAALWRTQSNVIVILDAQDIVATLTAAEAQGIAYTTFYEDGDGEIPTAAVLDPMNPRVKGFCRSYSLA